MRKPRPPDATGELGPVDGLERIACVAMTPPALRVTIGGQAHDERFNASDLRNRRPLDSARIARQRLRAIFGGSIGNLIEWYDWYTYAAFAIYFAPLFFPDDDPTAQLLNTAAIFAVGFLMRPIGGWVLGRYADRHGRKAALTLSVMLMCLGSLIIAVTPSYATDRHRRAVPCCCSRDCCKASASAANTAPARPT